MTNIRGGSEASQTLGRHQRKCSPRGPFMMPSGNARCLLEGSPTTTDHKLAIFSKHFAQPFPFPFRVIHLTSKQSSTITYRNTTYAYIHTYTYIVPTRHTHNNDGTGSLNLRSSISRRRSSSTTTTIIVLPPSPCHSIHCSNK
jgi:hypothetical protein